MTSTKTKKNLSGALNVLEVLQKKKNISDYMEIDGKLESSSPTSSHQQIISQIDTNSIIKWKHKDRPSSELGDINKLAEAFKIVGQQMPCIVRPYGDRNYELIIGERRWLAAKKAKLPLKVIIQNIDDKYAALAQFAENENREDLSPFAKGMSLSNHIKNGLLKQKDLEDTLGKSKQEITRLLSYSKIHPNVFDSIKDFSKVSPRTAYEISRLSNKGDEYVQILVSLSEYIKQGAIGANKLISEVNDRLTNKITFQDSDDLSLHKITDNRGRHLFTWRTDNNKKPSIHFPAYIVKLLNSDQLNIESLNKSLKEIIVSQLEKSPYGDKGGNK